MPMPMPMPMPTIAALFLALVLARWLCIQRRLPPPPWRLPVAALVLQRQLPANGPGVTLLSVALKGPTVWESTYACDEGPGDPSDPLAMVTAQTPPAVSLLLLDPTPADTALQARLKSLRNLCGKAVGRDQLAADFDLTGVVNADWPAQLPVRCPN